MQSDFTLQNSAKEDLATYNMKKNSFWFKNKWNELENEHC